MMLYYDRTDISEGIDINNKTNASKECDICLHKFQADVCNEYHDVIMMPINLDNIAILHILGVDYRCMYY